MLAASLVLIADPVAAAPPHPPTAVTVTVTNNSVTATVTPGTAGGGCAPTHHTFFLYHATSNVPAEITNTNGEKATSRGKSVSSNSHTIEGLSAGTTYRIAVSPYSASCGLEASAPRVIFSQFTTTGGAPITTTTTTSTTTTYYYYNHHHHNDNDNHYDYDDDCATNGDYCSHNNSNYCCYSATFRWQWQWRRRGR